MLVAIKTPVCAVCNEWSSVVVDHDDYSYWKSGALIQRALPYLNEEQRELLMTGTHPKCWEKMFEYEL